MVRCPQETAKIKANSMYMMQKHMVSLGRLQVRGQPKCSPFVRREGGQEGGMEREGWREPYGRIKRTQISPLYLLEGTVFSGVDHSHRILHVNLGPFPENLICHHPCL